MNIGDKVTLTSDGTLCVVIEINGTLVRLQEVVSGKRYSIHRAFVKLVGV